jgi:serine/threonine-protein kinase
MTGLPELEEDPQSERARARLGMVLQDKWKLESLIGVGGMAAVYAATHRNGKRVAVKMLHGELSHDEEVRTRFLREGYAANTLQHEGAVSVLDDDLAPDGSAFLVMELLDGETVERRWETQGGRLPVAEVLFIVDQLLDVLAIAHEKGVVHRDIKPENLFLTRTGVLKVLDFGIAKVFERQHLRANSTRAGTVMGTPAFMAPEQARARWDEVDGRTDLWAVGAMMFTLLSGRTVHNGETAQDQLIQSATELAPKLSVVVPDVPASVAAMVDRALSFEREGRFPNARSMQLAAREALDELGSALAPTSELTAVSALGAPLGRSTLRSGAGQAAVPLASSSSVPTWTREREIRLVETARLRALIVDLQRRFGAAKKKTAEALTRIEEAKGERASLEQWFARQAGKRTAAVDEARLEVRRSLLAFAQRALIDRAAFGAEFNRERDRIATLGRAADSAARDVRVHEAALDAHNPTALRTGLLVSALAVLVALALLIAPVVWRATRVIEPALPSHSQAPR